MPELTDHGTLNAHVSADGRGLDLLRIFLSTRVGGGYPRYGRVNAEGGVTYIVNRQQGAMPRDATLIISKDEANVLANALMDYLYGPGWAADARELERVGEKLEVSEKENSAMRKGKKASESRVKELEAELKELLDYRSRYQDLMAIVQAVNSGATHRLTGIQDCSD